MFTGLNKRILIFLKNAIMSFTALSLLGCAGTGQKNVIVENKELLLLLQNTCVPEDPLTSMRIECLYDETVSYKLERFVEYMKNHTGIDIPLSISPDVANKICKASPIIIAPRVCDASLGDCISYFCEKYDLEYSVNDDVILIVVKKNPLTRTAEELEREKRQGEIARILLKRVKKEENSDCPPNHVDVSVKPQASTFEKNDAK